MEVREKKLHFNKVVPAKNSSKPNELRRNSNTKRIHSLPTVRLNDCAGKMLLLSVNRKYYTHLIAHSVNKWNT